MDRRTGRIGGKKDSVVIIIVVVVEKSLEQKTTELTRTMKMGTRVNSESIREVSLTHSQSVLLENGRRRMPEDTWTDS